MGPAGCPSSPPESPSRNVPAGPPSGVRRGTSTPSDGAVYLSRLRAASRGEAALPARCTAALLGARWTPLWRVPALRGGTFRRAAACRRNAALSGSALPLSRLCTQFVWNYRLRESLGQQDSQAVVDRGRSLPQSVGLGSTTRGTLPLSAPGGGGPRVGCSPAARRRAARGATAENETAAAAAAFGAPPKRPRATVRDGVLQGAGGAGCSQAVGPTTNHRVRSSLRRFQFGRHHTTNRWSPWMGEQRGMLLMTTPQARPPPHRLLADIGRAVPQRAGGVRLRAAAVCFCPPLLLLVRPPSSTVRTGTAAARRIRSTRAHHAAARVGGCVGGAGGEGLTTAPGTPGRGLWWRPGDGNWWWAGGCVTTCAAQAARSALGRRNGVEGWGNWGRGLPCGGDAWRPHSRTFFAGAFGLCATGSVPYTTRRQPPRFVLLVKRLVPGDGRCDGEPCSADEALAHPETPHGDVGHAGVGSTPATPPRRRRRRVVHHGLPGWGGSGAFCLPRPTPASVWERL